MRISKQSASSSAGPPCAAARSEHDAATESQRREDSDAECRIASQAELYNTVRARTTDIVAPLEVEDYVVQTAPYMSPPRWHLGHTSWVFEMVLQDYLAGYRVQSDD